MNEPYAICDARRFEPYLNAPNTSGPPSDEMFPESKRQALDNIRPRAIGIAVKRTIIRHGRAPFFPASGGARLTIR